MTFVAFSEILRNLGLVVIAAGGLWLAYKRIVPATGQADAATAQAELARKAHVTSLFRDAASDLGSPALEVRLAAIYVLDAIRRDNPDLEEPVLLLVSAYLRGRAASYDPASPPMDVAAAVAMLERKGVVDDRSQS